MVENSFYENIVYTGEEERRLPVILLNYWKKIKGDRKFPFENSINPDDLKDIWEYCYLIQVNDLQNRLKVDFTFMGAEIVKAYEQYLGDDKDLIDIISPRSSRLAQNFQIVINEMRPLLQSGKFKDARGNIINFRQCLLPIGNNDSKVDAIFGCTRLSFLAK